MFNLKGKTAWAKISKTDTWQFKIDSITVAGKSALTLCKNCQASIQTILSFIRGPTSQVTSLMKSIGASVDKNQYYVVNCTKVSSLPNILFKINGFSISFSSKNYVYRENNVCTVMIFGGSDIWMLGSPFNRGVYTMFDITEKKIGFATSKTMV